MLTPLQARLKAFLPSFVGDHLDASSLRIVARCWAAAWACILVMVISRSEHAAGQAAFLSAIFIAIEPPSQPTIMVILRQLLAGIVVCAIWGWSVLGSKLADLARDKTNVQNVAQQLAAPILQAHPNTSYTDLEAVLYPRIFDGVFVDKYAALVSAVFLFFGTYALFLIRGYQQRLFFVMVFGIILLDIYMSITPIVPEFYSSLGYLYMIPYGYYAAINIVSAVLIFPTSVKYTQTERLYKISTLARAVYKEQEQVMALPVTELETFESASVTIRTIRENILQLAQFVNMFEPDLDKEITFGRYGAADMHKLITLKRRLLHRLNGFSITTTTLHRLLKEPHVKSEVSQMTLTDEISDILANLRVSAGDLVRDTDTALQSMRLFESRHTRYLGTKTSETKQFLTDVQAATAALTTSLAIFKSNKRFEVIERKPLESKTTNQSSETNREPPTLLYSPHARYVANLYCFHLEHFADSAVDVLRMLEEIESRPKRQWWFPTFSSRSSIKALLEWEGIPSGLSDESNPDRVEGINEAEEQVTDDEKAGTVAAKVKRPLWNRIIRWPFGTVPSYAAKVAALAVLTIAPAWAPASAGFFYTNRGIWASIIAQTCLGIHFSETTYGVFARVLGTFIGAVLGMVMWYISSANGTGNAYGIAAVFAVVWIPIMFYRVFSKDIITSLTVITTIVLVVGYSWLDGTLPQVHNPGFGWQLWWRRMLLVMIGVVAAYTAAFLPIPRTGKTYIRHSYISILSAIGGFHAELLDQIRQGNRVIVNPSSTDLARKLVAVHWKIRLLAVKLRLSGFEPYFPGAHHFPRDQYTKLEQQLLIHIDLLGELLGATNDIKDAKWRQALLASPVMQEKELSAVLSAYKSSADFIKQRKVSSMDVPIDHITLAFERPEEALQEVMNNTSNEWSRDAGFEQALVAAGASWHLLTSAKALSDISKEILKAQ